MKILFVCTGNTCRSPMAEQLAKDIFKKEGIDAEISSAGISVYYPSPPSANAVEAMKRRGLELSGHTSREVSEQDASADLILAMSNGHKGFLLGMFPEHRHKIFTLGEYAGDGEDISDPYGSSLENYIECADQLERLIEKVARTATQRQQVKE